MALKLEDFMQWPEIEALQYGECENPKSVLGPRMANRTNVLITAYLPKAEEVRVKVKGVKKEYKMEKNELIAKINETLAEEFEVEVSDITPEANIKETLQLDSLSLVDMVALIESEFGVKIKGAEMVQVQTFQALYDFIAERTA